MRGKTKGKEPSDEKSMDLEAFKERMSDIETMCPESAIAVSKRGVTANDKYTRDNVIMILKLIAQGYTQEDAALMVGVTARTLSGWKQKHEDFNEACERAKTVNISVYLNVIHKGMEKDPKLALAMLERIHPKKYAQTKRVEGTMSHAHEHGPSKLLLQLHEERKALDSKQTTDVASDAKVIEPIDAEELSDNCTQNTADGGGGEGSGPI